MCNTSVSEYQLYSASKRPARKVGIPRLEGEWIEGEYPTDNPLAAHTVDWKKLARQKLDLLPAFDGLIAAAGRLYLVAQNGRLVCFQAE